MYAAVNHNISYLMTIPRTTGNYGKKNQQKTKTKQQQHKNPLTEPGPVVKDWMRKRQREQKQNKKVKL